MLNRTLRNGLRDSRVSRCISWRNRGSRNVFSSLSSTSCLHDQIRNKSRFAYPEGMKAYEDDFVEEAEYPEINPETHLWNDRRRERFQKELDWRKKIKDAPNPEAKVFEYNYPHQYGYKNYRITEDCFDYDSQFAYKYITRTHVASQDQLPSQYSSPELVAKVQHFKEQIKGPLAEVLSFELDMLRGFEQDFNATLQSIDSQKSQSIVAQINRVILSVLGQEVDYLKSCHVDVKPRVEAFWEVGGLQPTGVQRRWREACSKFKSRRWRARYVKPEDPISYHMHYIGDPLLQVRCKNPVENFIDPLDSVCTRSIEEFPDKFPQFLSCYGFQDPPEYKHRFCSIIPGHWSGDINRCNLLAYHGRHHLLFKDRMGNKYWDIDEEIESALFSQAMLASFGRLLGQALYHGFDQFNDLEYPFSTQTILTNGLDWSFFAYQLNTMQLDNLSITKNQKQNILWGTKSESIFDKEKKGELNDSVLENLLKFYLNAPKPISVENPTPYLTRRIQEHWGNPDELLPLRPLNIHKFWRNLQEERQRYLIFYHFREMVCQRIYVTESLLAKRPPEVYDWERIYKMRFKARPLDKRLKYFELPFGFPGRDPFHEEYKVRDPTRISKGKVLLFNRTKERKEQERLEAEQKAEAEKHGVVYRPTIKKKIN